jgi:hypothetical protein
MLKNKIPFEELSIEDKFKKVFEEYRKQIEREVLYDVLTGFYFADWTRKCDYEKLTSEEVVEAAMEVCKHIEEKYNYSFDDEFSDITFGCGGDRDDD